MSTAQWNQIAKVLRDARDLPGPEGEAVRQLIDLWLRNQVAWQIEEMLESQLVTPLKRLARSVNRLTPRIEKEVEHVGAGRSAQDE